jgi:KDO2-lipid IV(A) lauroyltransferase
MTNGSPSAPAADPTTGTAYYAPAFTSEFYAPRYWLTWVALGIMRLCAALPLPVSHLVGAGVGMLSYALSTKRRHIAEVNLRLCFPETPSAERRRMVRRHFRASGRGLVDLGLIWWAPDSKLKRLVRFQGLDNFLDLVDRGHRIIVLTGHFIGADFGGTLLSSVVPGLVMMKAQRNALFNWYVWKGRTRFKGVTSLREQGLRPMIRALKTIHLCYYVPDEDFGPDHSVFAPFFGVPTATLPVLGKLAEKTQALVVPCFTRILPRGQGYEVVLKPPLEHFPTGDPQEDAARMNAALEEGVRAMPEQYLWTFRWFKSRPGNAPSPYRKRPG